MYGQYRWEEIGLNKDVAMSNFEREGFDGLQEAAGEAGLSALDLFSPEPVETNIKARIPCSMKTTTSVQAGGTYRFLIASERYSFIDPSSFRINTEFCIKQYNVETRAETDLTTLTPAGAVDAAVYPVDMMGNFLFKNIETRLNHTNISTTSSNTYGIKAALTTYLSYGADSGDTLLRASYHAKDIAGKKENIAANYATRARAMWIESSKTVQTSEPLFTEFNSCHRYIPPLLILILCSMKKKSTNY